MLNSRFQHLLILMPVAFIFFLNACSTKPLFQDDKRLLFEAVKTLEHLEKAYENKLSDRFMRKISDNYKSQEKNVLKNNLNVIFEEYRDIDLNIHSLRVVDVQPDKKTLKLRGLWRLEWKCLSSNKSCEKKGVIIRRKGEITFKFIRQDGTFYLLRENPILFGNEKPGEIINILSN